MAALRKEVFLAGIECEIEAVSLLLLSKEYRLGDADEALFAEMAQGQYTESKCAEIREGLLAYCKFDTLGMVEIYRVLQGISTL